MADLVFRFARTGDIVTVSIGGIIVGVLRLSDTEWLALRGLLQVGVDDGAFAGTDSGIVIVDADGSEWSSL